MICVQTWHCREQLRVVWDWHGDGFEGGNLASLCHWLGALRAFHALKCPWFCKALVGVCDTWQQTRK